MFGCIILLFEASESQISKTKTIITNKEKPTKLKTNK